MAIDLELLKKEYEEAIKSVESGFWTPREGENLIRILPPSPREKVKLFYRKVFVHYGVEGLGLVFCLENWKERCPVCEFVVKLRQIESVEAVNLAKRLVVVERFMMNIVPLDESEFRTVIRQWLAPKSVRLELLRLMLDKDWGDITDLSTGRNVIIERRMRPGTKFVEYGVRPKPNVSAISIDFEAIPAFDEILMEQRKTYDEIKIGMFGEEVEEGDEARIYLQRVMERRAQREREGEEREEIGMKEISDESKGMVMREVVEKVAGKVESEVKLSKDELVAKALKLLLEEVKDR